MLPSVAAAGMDGSADGDNADDDDDDDDEDDDDNGDDDGDGDADEEEEVEKVEEEEEEEEVADGAKEGHRDHIPSLDDDKRQDIAYIVESAVINE